MLTMQDLPKGVKAVLMDFDNTFYPYDPSHNHALKVTHEYFNVHIVPLDFEAFLAAYKKANKSVKQRTARQAASHSRVLYFHQLCEDYHGVSRGSHALQMEQLYWNAYINKMRLFDWVRPFLESLKESGIPVCLVTNHTTSLQFKKLNYFDLVDLVSYIVTSEEVGIEKPDSRMFKRALEKVGYPPESVVMIGDNDYDDGDGARALGIPFINVLQL